MGVEKGDSKRKRYRMYKRNERRWKDNKTIQTQSVSLNTRKTHPYMYKLTG